MSIYSELIDLTANILQKSPSEIAPDLSLEEQGADSLDIVELLLAIEDRYGVYIPDSEVVEMRTLSELAAWLEENCKL